MIDARSSAGAAARLEEAAADRFPDPLDSTGEEHQTGDAGQKSADLGAGRPAVGMPEIRALQHNDPRAVGQDRFESSSFLIIAPVDRRCHEDTSAN